jgi:hypothetical protein
MKIEDTLLEQIAEQIHNRWAAKRKEEGWTYGLERSDKNKEHPCLVPYEELSEVEKEYDRATARETMACLHELGYEIVKRK